MTRRDWNRWGSRGEWIGRNTFSVTGKGLIDELVFDMYFYNGGNAYEKILTYNVNEPLVTPSFSKSDDAAIQYHTSSPLVELPMYFSCFNLLLML